MLNKQIEVLKNNQLEKTAVLLLVFEPVVASVLAPIVEPVGIEDIIYHKEHETRIDLEPYTEHTEYGDIVAWDKYVKEHLDEDMHDKISNGNVVFEMLKDTYDGNSEKAIFRWFNQVEATERLEN